MTKNSTNDSSGTAVDFAQIDNTGGSDVVLLDNLIPLTTNSYTLGSSTNKYSTCFASTVDVSNVTSAGNVNFNPTGDVTTQKIVRPLTDNATTLGTAIRRWSTTFSTNVSTDNVTSAGNVNINPTGTVVVAKDVLPDVTASRNLGSNALRYAAVHTGVVRNNSGDVALQAGTGFNVTSDKSIVPSVDNTHSIGLTGSTWLNVRATNVVASSVVTPVITTSTITPLLLDPLGGNIRWATFLEPASNACRIGASGNRVSNGFFDNLNTTGVETSQVTTSSGSLTLTTASGGDDIVQQRRIRPNTDLVHSLGSTSLRYTGVHALNFVSSASQVYTAFTTVPSNVSSTTFIDVPLGVISNPNYNGGTVNTFKVPSNGLYRFEFTNDVTTLGSDTRMYFSLTQDGTPIWPTVGALEHIVGGAYARKTERFVMTFELLSGFTTARFAIRMRVSAGTVSNQVLTSALLIRVHAFD